MTPRELVQEQIRHHETPYVPYVLPMEDDVRRRLTEWYGSGDWESRLVNHIVGISVIDIDAPCKVDEIHERDRWGTLWRCDKRPRHLEAPPISEPVLRGYRFPSVDEVFRDNWHSEGCKRVEQNRDRFVVHGIGFGLFERSWTLRGFENALMDIVLNPKFYEALLDGILELYLQIIDRLVTLPIDGVMLSDDYGDQRGVIMGADKWRRFIKPRLAMQIERIKAGGKIALLHCCGNISEIVPDMIEIGLDVLESVQPMAMDPYELKREYGRHITFWGGLCTQHLLPFGRPWEIRAEVERLCVEMASGGGYILAPAKPLMPEVPTENAVAVLEAFIEQAEHGIS